MKKVILLFFIGLIILNIKTTKAGIVEIPNEAIRLRVIANSNSNYDQQVKMKVKDNLENTIYDILKDTTNVDEARNLINNNMYKINNSIKDILVSEKYNLDYDINFGKNYFPEKEYNGILYQEGYYESILVTLGNGEGDNWWCVLFPPLCLLEAEESDEVEYKFFVQELIDKYF